VVLKVIDFYRDRYIEKNRLGELMTSVAEDIDANLGKRKKSTKL
jgi:hypothetical protein